MMDFNQKDHGIASWQFAVILNNALIEGCEATRGQNA
jgi:hypothetical protein